MDEKERPIISSKIKVQHGSLKMWRNSQVSLYSNYILVSTGISNPSEQKIDLFSLVDVKITNTKDYFEFCVKYKETEYLMRVDCIQKLEKWVSLLKTSVMSLKKLKIDDFSIISTLGRGYFGKVLLVEHNVTHEIYAIKAIKKSSLVEKGKVHTIFTEKDVLMKSHHPFIVNMIFAFQNEKKFYIGLEYVPGGSLFRFLHIGNTTTEENVRFYVAEVALALDYLHSLGILYRDLKLENVLLAADGHIKLTDFGLSKNLSSKDGLSSTSTFCGTNEYLSPEMISDEDYSFEIDWWALGIFTYELLYGETPFYDKNVKKMFERIKNKDPKFPNHASPEAKNFITKLLEKNPKKRPTFEEIKEDPFFSGIDWNDALQKKLIPPCKPKCITGRRATNVGEKYRKDLFDSDADAIDFNTEFENFTVLPENM